jgi:hypothetical protein
MGHPDEHSGALLMAGEKTITAEYAETAELFIGKDKKHLRDRDSSLLFDPPGIETRG